MAAAKFLKENVEDGDYNQYWYSTYTIDRIVEDLVEGAKGEGAQGEGTTRKLVFLSTPSLYFSLPEDVRARSFVFDVSLYKLKITSLCF